MLSPDEAILWIGDENESPRMDDVSDCDLRRVQTVRIGGVSPRYDRLRLQSRMVLGDNVLR